MIYAVGQCIYESLSSNVESTDKVLPNVRVRDGEYEFSFIVRCQFDFGSMLSFKSSRCHWTQHEQLGNEGNLGKICWALSLMAIRDVVSYWKWLSINCNIYAIRV